MRFGFAHPWALVLLAVPAVLSAWWWWRGRVLPSLRLPALEPLLGVRPSLRVRTRWLVAAGRLVALAVIVVALARPRGGQAVEHVTTQGVDIMIALDTSGSMLAEDMSVAARRLNRLDAAKEVVADFVRHRTADRIGLISFDEVAVPKCPPTLDYDVLLDFLKEVSINGEGGRTAIGMALASGVNRLKASDAKSRIIILVTDGRNNAGRIEPEDAAEMARLLGIRIYAIGVGTTGLADYPVQSSFGLMGYRKIASDVDEETLKMLATTTGGRYFRAVDHAGLASIFEYVDKLEKTEINVERHVRYEEYFPRFVQAAAVVLSLALVLGATLWRTFP